MNLNYFLAGFLIVGVIAIAASLVAIDAPPDQQESDLLTRLGNNNNPQITESSGLAHSRIQPGYLWTINDSGNPNNLWLLETNGQLRAKLSVANAKNVDWEAMAGFLYENRPYLLIADVGDNLARRKEYQLYVLPEPDLSSRLEQNGKAVIEQAVFAQRISFTYEDGPRNCEAIGVTPDGTQVWLVEKGQFSISKKESPGIYTVPLNLTPKPGESKTPLVAKRIASFPPINVTGMDFSPDGNRLIIRNYVSAHLYERDLNSSWEQVVKTSKPKSVVLPLQRQGEAICFTQDSKSVIVTSETRKQPIWQVNLEPRPSEKKHPE